MGKEVLEGRLFIFEEYEWWEALITDKNKEELLKELNKDSNTLKDPYEDQGDHIWRGNLRIDDLREHGILIRDILEKLHGRKVRITIEVIE